MSLLELKDIGKIYSSDGVTAVGIRGVNLSFDLGEFVAVTGKSGSGKTTLLNVISGMDSFEEGEMYIGGEPTSHYTQGDFELYRNEYISFVFQDYNVIDSFTVLQNVELALGGMKNKKERRKRALELIDRVGLTAYKNSRASKLSGGQKQRTVIARALAKDSPIILCDEPTGNLDAKTGEEIVALLKEISESKLVIVVTHALSELEGVATREIRMYDGTVERDTRIKSFDKGEHKKDAETKKLSTARRGAELGAVRFLSRPKLSVFTCLLLILGAIGTFLVTALFSGSIFTDNNSIPMFTHIDGRVIIMKQDGAVITDSELAALTSEFGALRYDHFDALTDRSASYFATHDSRYYSTDFKFTTEPCGSLDEGRLPTAHDEVALTVPISFKPLFSSEYYSDPVFTCFADTVSLKVVGIKYFYDNTADACRAILTEEGFESLKYNDFFTHSYAGLAGYMRISATENGEVSVITSSDLIAIDKDLRGGEFYFVRGNYYSPEDDPVLDSLEAADTIELVYDIHTSDKDTVVSSCEVEAPVLLRDKCRKSDEYYSYLVISREAAEAIYTKCLSETYSQASLYFSNDIKAASVIDTLYDKGYVAALSDATYSQSNGDTLLNFVLAIVSAITWLGFVGFIAFFISMCSSRVFLLMQSDIAIMRSMGIEKNTIRLSNLIFILISMIPTVVVTAALAFLIYTSPHLNGLFTFIHAPGYILMFAGLLLIALVITRRYNKKTFCESVRKTLNGGSGK